MTARYAKRVPWYHQPKKRCITQTARQTQCLNSASWVVKGTNDGDGNELEVCKPHADMLALEGYRVAEIRPRRITMPAGTGRVLRAVS